MVRSEGRAMITSHQSPEQCEVCRERLADLMDSEHGPICMSCHDQLARVDHALGAFSLPITREQPTKPPTP